MIAHGLSDTTSQQAVAGEPTTGLGAAGILAVGAVAAVAWWACQYVASAAGSLDGSNLAALLALLWGVGAVFGGVVVTMVVLAVALTQFGWALGYVGGLVLLALYAVVMVANSKIAADSVVS